MAISIHHQTAWAIPASARLSAPWSIPTSARLSASWAIPASARLGASWAIVAPVYAWTPSPLVWYGTGKKPPLRINLLATWGIPTLARLGATWSDAPILHHQNATAWSDAPILHHRNAVSWSDAPILHHRNAASWSDATLLHHRHLTAWGLRVAARRHLTASWAVRGTNPVRAHHTSAWAIPASARIQSLFNQPELGFQDTVLRIMQANVHQDEGSPFWMAEIDLARIEDYARITVGDTVHLGFGPQVFRLVIDSKGLTRAIDDRGTPTVNMTLTALSPLALLDAPFASAISLHRTGPTSARDLIQDLLGPVQWQLPDWNIPAGRAIFENATPLAIARRIAEAIGGLIESLPDGSIVARMPHAPGAANHTLTDGDILDLTERVAWERGFNRITISNEDIQIASADRLEANRDENDPYLYRVRAWPDPWRIAALWHSGHPDTRITTLGERFDTEEESVEFVAGEASLRYPPDTLTGIRWQHADLGPIQADGTRLTSAKPGYSLCKITYTTRILAWEVALARDEEVQFILGD